MTSSKIPNRFVLALATGLTGLYIYDVQYNHGKTVDQLGLYNWNPPPKIEPFAESAYNSGLQKADEFKSTAGSWISEKNQNVQDTAASAGHQLKDTVNSASSQVIDKLESSKDRLSSLFGSSKDAAERSYEAATNRLREAQKKADESRKGWLSWGESKDDDARKELDNAKKNLEDARNNLSKWGADALKEAENKANQYYEDAKKGGQQVLGNLQARKDQASNVLSKKLSDKEFQKQADKAAAGFGSLNAEVAGEHSESLYDTAGLLAIKSRESAEKVYNYYDEQAKLAKKQYDETQSSWFKWRKAKSQEIQDAAKKQLDDLEGKRSQAQSTLNKYLDQASKNIKDNSGKLVDQTQKGLKDSHDAAQGWLSKLGSWVRGN